MRVHYTFAVKNHKIVLNFYAEIVQLNTSNLVLRFIVNVVTFLMKINLTFYF